MTNFAKNALAGSDPEYIAVAQYVSEPLTAQTISGTVKGQLRCMESAAAFNGTIAVLIKVVSFDGKTVRGTLLSLSASDATTTPPEFAASLTNRKLMDVNENPLLSLTSVDAQDGDRIVVELGIREVDTNAADTG